MEKQKKDLNNKVSINEGEKMALTYWNRVFAGASGGALVVGGFWFIASISGDIRWLGFIAVALGILALFFGRYG